MASSKIYHRQFYGQISNPEGAVLHPPTHRQLSNSFSSYGSTGNLAKIDQLNKACPSFRQTTYRLMKYFVVFILAMSILRWSSTIHWSFNIALQFPYWQWSSFTVRQLQLHVHVHAYYHVHVHVHCPIVRNITNSVQTNETSYFTTIQNSYLLTRRIFNDSSLQLERYSYRLKNLFPNKAVNQHQKKENKLKMKNFWKKKIWGRNFLRIYSFCF